MRSTPTSPPQRIQRLRTKGWRMPEGAVYVGRPSRWGNCYKVGDPHPVHGWPMSPAEAVELFTSVLPTVAMYDYAQAELRGRTLACWCPVGQPCHGDVLLRVANQPATSGSKGAGDE